MKSIRTDGFGVVEGGGLGDTKLVVVVSRRVGFVWKIRYILITVEQK